MPRLGQKLFTRKKRARFLEHLRSLPDVGDCVLWPGTTRAYYGRVYTDVKNQKFMAASRWVYEQIHGAVPAGLYILHTCDNPPCVRPGHLWIGTTKDNLADAARKGRMRGPGPYDRPRGEHAPNAKLTDVDVRMIRALHGKVSQADIARRFGVGETQIGRIVRGESRVC